MKFRLTSFVGWTAALLLGAFNLFAAVMKFMPVEPGSAADAMGQQLGIKGLESQLGVLEFVVVALFLIPRTSAVGTVLMAGYTGGILATMLTHGFSHMEAMPIYVSLLLLAIAGYFRNPELSARLRGAQIPA